MYIKRFILSVFLFFSAIVSAQGSEDSIDEQIINVKDTTLLKQYRDSIAITKNDLEYQQRVLRGLMELNDITIGPVKYEIPKLQESLSSLDLLKKEGKISDKKYNKEASKIRKVLLEYEALVDKTNLALAPKQQKIEILQKRLEYLQSKLDKI